MAERKDLPSADPVDVKEFLSQFLGTAKDVVNRYTHCSMCGANLHFSHITDFSRNLTQETARCLECGIKIRRLVHRLH